MLEAAIIKTIKSALKIDAHIGFKPESSTALPAVVCITLSNKSDPFTVQGTNTRRSSVISFKVLGTTVPEVMQLQYQLIRLFEDSTVKTEKGYDFTYDMVTSVVGTNNAFTSMDLTCTVDVHVKYLETKTLQ
ncbi:hypothetical protein [Aeromonas dhakensis]|uniref:hypothetical protein n=1 Tax=Aeromonas dhakensis TaxID=196024 RepID=UPI0012FD7FBC|nr:hypothetical protein [Aeromonas dhakensis]